MTLNDKGEGVLFVFDFAAAPCALNPLLIFFYGVRCCVLLLLSSFIVC